MCLGTGPIRDIIAGLSAPYSEEGFNEIAFMQFLNLLDDFVAWESLEGVPYRHLADIPKQTIDNLAIVHEEDLQYILHRMEGNVLLILYYKKMFWIRFKSTYILYQKWLMDCHT